MSSDRWWENCRRKSSIRRTGPGNGQRSKIELVTTAVIDYGLGNLASVRHALMAAGSRCEVVADPRQLHRYASIVLPGVGAFADGMQRLRQQGWVEVLEEETLGKRKPFLGLCLGMQLLAGTGMEHGETEGLGWIPGVVRPLRSLAPAVRVPHVGWNDASLDEHARLLKGLGQTADFYFVHSFVLVPDDQSLVTARCDYGAVFAAAVESENIFATQFHPEKSQQAGLKILSNFHQLCT